MVDGGVRGLFVMEDDPAASPRTAEALRKLDFLVVQDLFMTETARLAHVLFPATTWAESDGTYTNLERRIQQAPDGIDPVANCVPGWSVMTLLAERWIAAQQPQAAGEAVADWKRKKRAHAAAKGAPAPKPWSYPTAQTVLEEISKAVPSYGTLRWENLTEQGQQWPASALVRPPRRVEPLEVQPVPAVQAGQFLLASGPVLWDGGALMQHAAGEVRNLMPQPYVALHPADMKAGGYTEGQLAAVASSRASVTLTLCADPSVQPGTAWIPYGLQGLPAETLGAGRGESVSLVIASADAALAGPAEAHSSLE
jgi:predicted molibdopterin-dependent oxidoreductase YjgC